VIGDILEVRVMVEDIIEDIEEETEGELIEVIYDVELFQNKEDRTASLR